MPSATASQPKEFFLTDSRITADIQTLNYLVYAVDELGNRKNFNILVPYYVQVVAQIEKFLLNSTGTKWTVLTKELAEQQPSDEVDQAQDEFEQYIEQLNEVIIERHPVTEAEDYLLSAGYDAKAMLVCSHTKLYRMYVKGRPEAIALANAADLLGACKKWVKDEESRKRDREAFLRRWAIA